MKYKRLKLFVVSIIIFTGACNEPETVVTDIVHKDGSITRRIEMKNQENNFRISNVQVPYDSTWTVRDSLEINGKGDTIWVKRAEKVFKNVNELNLAYKSDSSGNRNVTRRVEYSKKFRWFQTVYRFSEKIENKMLHGYPVSDFLNKQELAWFYSPHNVNEKKKEGPDSLEYRALADSVNNKTELWTTRSIVSEWIAEFSDLIAGKTGTTALQDSLKAREEYITGLIMENEDKFDSLWTNGILLADIAGKSGAEKYKQDADSALDLVTDRVFVDFKNYTVRMVLPGRVTATNGFIDSTHVLLWPVISDYFLTTPYVMWAESKVPNTWAWIVSGLFIGFVFTGIIVRKK